MRKGRRRKKSRAKKRKPKRRGRPPTARDQVVILTKLQQAAAAWLVGLSPRSLRDALDAPRKMDGTYDGRALLVWWLAREREKQSDVRNEQLERLRAARAAAAERDNKLKEGKLVEIDQVLNIIGEKMRVLMIQLESLERIHGPAVGQAIRTMIQRGHEASVRGLAAGGATVKESQAS